MAILSSKSRRKLEEIEVLSDLGKIFKRTLLRHLRLKFFMPVLMTLPKTLVYELQRAC